jgi:hypothetical protein
VSVLAFREVVMAILRAMAAFGAVLGLMAAAIAAPNPPAARQPGANARAKLVQAARSAGRRGHHHTLVGVVVHVHRNKQNAKTGTITVRIGSSHHHRTGTRAAARQHHHTVQVQVNDITQFERTVATGQGSRAVPATFGDVHRNKRVKILRHSSAQQMARLVNILDDGQQHRRATTTVRRASIRRQTIVGGSGEIVVRKLALRHPLIVGNVTRKLGRIEKHVGAAVTGHHVIHHSKPARTTAKSAEKVPGFFEGHKPPASGSTKKAKVTVKAGVSAHHAAMPSASNAKPAHSSHKPTSGQQGHKGSSSHKKSSSHPKK